MATITGIKAGSTTITASYGGKTATANITVSAIAPSLTFTVNSASLTYDGSAKKLGTVSYNGDGTAYYIVSTSSTVPAANATGWTAVPSNKEITYTNAGTYYVHLKATAGTNYTAVNPKIGNSTGKQIAQRTVTVTAPSYVSSALTYNGSAQTVASGGSCTTGGTMYYYISTSSTAPTVTAGSAPGSGWTTSNPTATGKGTYYVWYYCYVADTSNNTGSNINTVKALSGTKAIAQRTVTVTAPTATNRTYNGSAQTIFSGGSCSTGGTMYFSDTNKTFSTSTWSTTIPTPQRTTADTYTLYYYAYVSDTTNNTGSNLNTIKSVQATISKKATTAPSLTAGTKATYDGSAVYAKAATGSGNPAGTIYYGATSGATTYSLTASSTAANMSSMGRTDVGTTTIYAFFRPTDTTNYADSSVVSTTASVTNKATGYATASTANKTYNGSAQTIATVATNSGDYYFGLGSSTTSAPTSWGTKNSSLSQTAAGTYYVWMKADTSTNYNAVSQKYIATVTISKRTVTITAPTKTDRTYNGSAQTIFTAGSASTGGTMYYSASDSTFSTSTWSTTIPNASQTNADTYTLYYYCYVSDTANNTGTDINTKKSIQATIGKKSTAAPSLTAGTKATYDGNPVYATAKNGSGNPAGTIYYGATSGATTYSITASTTATNLTSMGQTNVGSTTIYAFFRPTDTANYSDSSVASTTASVTNKATGYATASTSNKTYNGSAQTIATKSTNSGDYYFGLGSSATSAPTSWGSKNTALSQTAAGTYYVWMKADASTNYAAVAAKHVGTVTISKRTVTITAPTKTDKTYNGSAQTIFTAGSATTGGTMYYSASDTSFSTSTWSTTIPNASQTNADTYTLYYYCYVSDTANNTGTDINTKKSIQATIAKKSTSSPTLTAGGNSTYTGTTYYAKAANASGNPAGTIYYGTSAGSTSYSLSVTAGATTAANLSSMGRANVGTTTIYVFFRPTDTTNYEDSGNATTKVEITNKATGYATASTTDRTYNGSNQTIATAATNSGDYYFGLGTSTTSAPSSWGSKNTALSQMNAGTYYVWMKADTSTNYAAVSAKYVGTVTIAKRTVTVTAPTKTDRTYSGSEQVIFATGSASTGGTMYYNTSNTTFSTSSWSTSLPYTKKTNAGDYTIYWYCYVADTANNTGTGINTATALTATIGKKATTAPALTAGSKTTYDGGTVYAKAANVSGNPAGTIYYGATSGATTYNMSVAAGATTAANMTSMGQTSVGTKTIYAFFRPSDTTNYSDSSVASTTAKVVNKANLTVTEVNYSGTYDGSSHSSSVKVTSAGWTGKTIVSGTSTSYGTTVTSNGAVNTVYALKTATDYTASTTIYYKITGDTNYNDYADSVTFAISKAAGYATASTTNRTYSGSSQTIATKSTNSGDYYFGLGSSTTSAPTSWGSKNTALSATNAGTYYVWMKADAATNYNAVDAKYIGTVTIAQRTVTITAPTKTDRTYTGSNQTIFTAGSATAGGVMYYSTSNINFDKSNSNWSTTIPYTQKSAAGTYTIYWYCLVEDTANNTGTGINTKNTLTATIGQAAATLPTTWSGDSKEYHATATLTATGYSGGTLKYRYDVNNGTSWTETTTAPTRTAIGTTAVQCMVVGDANHSNTSWSSTVTLTVYKSDDARMTVTPGSSLTYNGSAKNIATASGLEGVGTYYLGYKKDSQATADSQITAGSANATPLTATNAGTYYIYYKFSPDSNHENSNVPTVGTYTYVGSATINKASRSGAVTFKSGSTTVTSIAYPNTVTASVSGNTESGTVTWSVTNGTGKATVNSSGVVTPTQAGTVTVTASVAATNNYAAYTASATLTINKGTGSVSYSPVTSVTEPCTTNPTATSTMQGDREITIATASASSSTNTGVTITYSIDKSGWSISSDGKKITVPSGTAANTYNINVTATAPATTNYNQATTTKSISVVVDAQVLTGISLTLGDSTISYNGTTTATVVATFKYGQPIDVTSDSGTSYSTNPTGIVTITK